MVKPPKTMQPEAINVEKAGRSTNASFGEDSFRNYMARKIDMQRQQFGLILPPPPESESNETKKNSKRRVSFSEDVKGKKEKKRKKSGIQSVLKRLQRRHGSRRKRKRTDFTEDQQETDLVLSDEVIEEFLDENVAESPAYDEIDSTDSESRANKLDTETRKDLFFRGVVVMVNGYTDPDVESLQRMLHKHGGDLEKYETSRITHIIAERLSTAKANIYKKQRKPTPVCYPAWIVESVQAQLLLPYGPYLIKEVRERFAATGSIAQLFCQTKVTTMPSDAYANEKPESEPPVLKEMFNSSKTSEEMLDETSQRSHSFTVSPINESGAALPHETSEYPDGLSSQSQDTHTLMNNSDSGYIATNDIRRRTDSSADVTIVNQPDEVAKLIEESNESHDSSERVSDVAGNSPKKDSKYINGRIRTVGTDPDFLESFFSNSRLSFIGSYKQRARSTSTLQNEKRANEQRYVFHIDMDCFFAAVALRKYPAYRDKPVVISHFGLSPDSNTPADDVNASSTSECATCNYHARKYGIKKGMYLGRAKQLCPDLVVLKYDFDGYEEVSEQVTDILEEQADLHSGNLEQVSCDEAFLEIFLEVSNESLQKVVAIAETIRTTICEVTSCTATVGVASNKFLAKLATDRVKPNGSFVVDDPKELLRELKLRDLHGIGHKLERKLEEERLVTVQDVWDLGEEGEGELIRVLGPGIGKKIWLFCRGVDDRPVQPAERKTIGAECNYGVRFNGPYGVDHMMKGLAKEVEKRMSNVGVKGSKITLKLKQRKLGAPPPPKFLGHGSCHNLSRCCEIPFGAATRDNEILFSCGMKLFEEMSVCREDIRGMGIVVSKLVLDKAEAIDLRTASEPSILDFFKNSNPKPATNKGLSGQKEADRMEHRSTEDVSVVKVYYPTSEIDYDIVIPSQLHLSQVDQLPSPMKRAILSKIDAANLERKMPSVADANLSRDTRLLQTDMRRMMKLAAVKNGDETIPGSSNLDISMTQLESLPLEVQLQIANGDNRPIGLLSRKSRIETSSGKALSARAASVASDKPKPRGKRTLQESTTDCDAEIVIVDSDDDEQDHSAPIISSESTKQNFFQENIKPLMIFMDENSCNNEEAVSQVLEFFHAVVANEERHHDAVVLLRSMKRREDAWSGHPFNLMFEEVNSAMQRTFGHELDPQIFENNVT